MLVALERLAKELGAGGGSRTLTGLWALRIFLPTTAFAVRMELESFSGLRSGLSLHHLPDDLGLRCCPSSLYTFPACAGLGSGLPQLIMRFPRIWAVLHRWFPGEHSSFSQVRCVCHSATPAWRSDYLSIIGQDCYKNTSVSRVIRSSAVSFALVRLSQFLLLGRLNCQVMPRGGCGLGQKWSVCLRSRFAGTGFEPKCQWRISGTWPSVCRHAFLKARKA